jgi:CO/xanthine dehydrogenase Mo-binding subunit
LPQIAAEELDLGMDQVSTIPLDTHMTPNQGGTYSSASIARGGPQIRTAAAEARQALLGMASERLGVPTSDLSVSRGVVRVGNDSTRSVTYGELIGDQLFNLEFTGNAPVKNPDTYQVVATPAARADLPAKVQGTYTYMQHLRRPNMLHGRVVRPRGRSGIRHERKHPQRHDECCRDREEERVRERLGGHRQSVRSCVGNSQTQDGAGVAHAHDSIFADAAAAETTDRSRMR